MDTTVQAVQRRIIAPHWSVGEICVWEAESAGIGGPIAKRALSGRCLMSGQERRWPVYARRHTGKPKDIITAEAPDVVSAPTVMAGDLLAQTISAGEALSSTK